MQQAGNGQPLFTIRALRRAAAALGVALALAACQSTGTTAGVGGGSFFDGVMVALTQPEAPTPTR